MGKAPCGESLALNVAVNGGKKDSSWRRRCEKERGPGGSHHSPPGPKSKRALTVSSIIPARSTAVQPDVRAIRAEQERSSRLGLSVFPLGPDKIPIVRWAPYQTNRPSYQVRFRMFRKPNVGGVAIITGKV